MFRRHLIEIFVSFFAFLTAFVFQKFLLTVFIKINSNHDKFKY